MYVLDHIGAQPAHTHIHTSAVIDKVGIPNTISGTDFAGVVVQLGSAIPASVSVKVGDRVAGFTQGGTYEDRGAYAEYVKAAAELVWPIPEGVSFEEAATMGCS